MQYVAHWVTTKSVINYPHFLQISRQKGADPDCMQQRQQF